MSIPKIDPASVALKALVVGFRVTGSLVANSMGQTISKAGNSGGLGNRTDLQLLMALRRQSEIVLTSGATFRADEYKFPSNADLAVLTRGSIALSVPDGRKLLTLQSSYLESLADLRHFGYQRIHVEFGERGMKELVSAGAIDSLVLSSPSESGLELLARRFGVNSENYLVEDLFVKVVAFQR